MQLRLDIAKTVDFRMTKMKPNEVVKTGTCEQVIYYVYYTPLKRNSGAPHRACAGFDTLEEAKEFYQEVLEKKQNGKKGPAIVRETLYMSGLYERVD